jgi:SAM-dependent methyltransferase
VVVQGANEYQNTAAEFYDYFELGQPGDTRFYVEEAKKSTSPVLELGCGTGRSLIPIAQAGVEVVGLDRSQSMLDIAYRKTSGLDRETRWNITLQQDDMRTFSLGQQFGVITVPNRSFSHLVNIEDQHQALDRIRNHLIDGGRFIFNIFDPNLEWIVEDHRFPESPLRKHAEFIHPASGNTVFVWVTRDYDLEHQLIKQDYLFEETNASGKVVERSYSSLTLRFSYRYEIQHLLALSGFQVETLYGDFSRNPFRHGAEQIWLTRKR